MTEERSAALGHDGVLPEMVRLLVDAGATPASAVRAATALEQGGTVHEAWAHIEIAYKPAEPSGELLAAEITRARERVLAGATA